MGPQEKLWGQKCPGPAGPQGSVHTSGARLSRSMRQTRILKKDFSSYLENKQAEHRQATSSCSNPVND